MFCSCLCRVLAWNVSLPLPVTKASWLQVLGIQEYVYQYLGAGPVAFLHGQVVNEEEATLEERAHFRLLQTAAQSSPYCADGGDLNPARPRVNPSHLLAVPIDADADAVRLPAGALPALVLGLPLLRCLSSLFMQYSGLHAEMVSTLFATIAVHLSSW